MASIQVEMFCINVTLLKWPPLTLNITQEFIGLMLFMSSDLL